MVGPLTHGPDGIQSVLDGRRPVRKKDVWVRRAGTENALFDPETQAVHLLNATALAIWNLCDGETEPAEMIMAICELSRLHEDVVTEDVARALADLERARLITWSA